MKIACLFSLVFISLFTSCEKSEEAPASLSGTWRLVEARGMFVIRDFPPDRVETITFEGNTYQLKIGENITEGDFTTADDPTVAKEVCLEMPPGRYTRTIRFSKRSSDQKIFYEFDGDTLKMISGCFALDGGSEKIYKRS